MADRALLQQWAQGQGLEDALPLPADSRLLEAHFQYSHQGFSRLRSNDAPLSCGLPDALPPEGIILP